jgi:hypothetical protein
MHLIVERVYTCPCVFLSGDTHFLTPSFSFLQFRLVSGGWTNRQTVFPEDQPQF